MNSLTLRISNGGGKKARNNLSCTPVNISSFIDERIKNNTLIRSFLEAETTDKQLAILKSILDENRDAHNENAVTFLVIVFFYSETKHPIKSFLSRHITKNENMQKPFSNNLAKQILVSINEEAVDYKIYISIVSKMAACIENFPTGSIALKNVESEIGVYFTKCVNCCVATISATKTLSPTEKNEIYNLCHLALRLLLYLVQKTENVKNLAPLFPEVRLLVRKLLFDDDVPMDTKSVCGILYLSIHVLEVGQDSWVDVFQPKEGDLSDLLKNEAAQLSLYSAVTTVVSIGMLETTNINGKAAGTELTNKIISIGERNSSESTFILAVARTILQISKILTKVTNHSVGLQMVDSLLTFIYAHLEHYMDSVRHLTAQSLGNIVRYCTSLKKNGNEEALNNLFNALTSLDKTRKSYYVSLTSLTNELGAKMILERLPSIINEVMSALNIQAVQASATTTLEILLQKHVRESTTEVLYHLWIESILSFVEKNVLETGVLNIMELLLTKAVKFDEQLINYILPYIKRSCKPGRTCDMKCILMLLSVARKSGMTAKLSPQDNDTEWKGIINYDVLKMAAVDAVDETRILSLSLIVESPKSTEVFAPGDLNLVLHYLKYNINAQSPNFRQLTLSLMKKFMQRFDDSYKVLKKLKDSDVYYLDFLEELRELCFGSLIQGTNYSRRFIALQTLVWCENLHLESYQRIWKHEYVEKLLFHLEDSYENNKSFALEILGKCPTELLKNNKYSTSLLIEDILRQASSLKPTDCISAAYKLLLLRNKLPDNIMQGCECDSAEPVTYVLLKLLQERLCQELSICQQSIVNGAIRAPMYGILHCMVHIISRVNVSAISEDSRWSSLISEVVTTCVEVNAAVAAVVNNSSPEGHLPMDMSGVVVNDYGNSGGIKLEDGRQVTAQMVLLCAWRSVKEVSLLLGEISSRLSITDEASAKGTLAPAQLALIGEHFTHLLAETKHRGAFEQAYVGFTKLLARLWRCRNPTLHELPRTWLSELMVAIESGDKKGMLCATRRSAGLPFMIQALVTTELQVHGNPKCFHQCMSVLLRLARTRTDDTSVNETAIEMRTHSINILRALFRNSALDESVASYIGEGLVVALEGFEGGTWMERNSSTLLFSALMVRVFGVQRSRDADNLCVRNRMTGRIFFLRYPMLYDFMLAKLQEVSESEDTQLLRPSLYPILLLLARLYPSSLEGTVSNLKLVAYIPHVLACAKSSVFKTRQLAAKAMVPLISPEQYISHSEAMFSFLADQTIPKNYCHGILLQLVRLFDARPETLVVDDEINGRLQNKIKATLWILEQATEERPCYLLADEYVKLFNNIILRFPSLVVDVLVDRLEAFLDKLLFKQSLPHIDSGRDICLANALNLYFIILNKYRLENILQVIYKSLSHDSYEVTLTVLNYLLILHEELETENKLQENLLLVSNKHVLEQLRQKRTHIQLLCDILKKNKYLECSQKTLKVLTLEKDTEKCIVEMKAGNTCNDNDFIIHTLFDCIQNEHENLTHIYLESLSNFISKQLQESTIKGSKLLDIIRTIFACSSSDNSDETRSVVVKFIENNVETLLGYDLAELSEEEKFEYKVTLYATIVRVLEDDDALLRQRTSNAVTRLSQATCKVISCKAGEMLRDMIAQESDAIAVFVVLALLDFKSEVCVTDDVSDECRVFDHNEKYNIFLEETVWTSQCADKILQLYNNSNTNVLDHVKSIIETSRKTFEKLCGNNLTLFEDSNSYPYLHYSKVQLFINRLL